MHELFKKKTHQNTGLIVIFLSLIQIYLKQNKMVLLIREDNTNPDLIKILHLYTRLLTYHYIKHDIFLYYIQIFV